MKALFTAILIVSLISLSIASEKDFDVIYGVDNRKDVFESRNSILVELSKSTAAMIQPIFLSNLTNGNVQISGGTLQSRGICAKERFSNQVSVANCSGFLVAPHILVTAGHCINTDLDCSAFKWVFDYKVENNQQNAIQVPPSSVYSCKKIISRKLDPSNKDDFAVIELDRKVLDRSPLAFRRVGKISKGTSVAVIGHPTGLPTKIADSAKVRSNTNKYFVTNLDTYGGNSGSAVFNTKTSEVEGVLVRGENDYIYNSTLGCYVSKICQTNGCRGEEVTYITNIQALRDIKD